MMTFEEIEGLRKWVCYQIGLFLYRKKSKITEFWNCAMKEHGWHGFDGYARICRF